MGIGIEDKDTQDSLGYGNSRPRNNLGTVNIQDDPPATTSHASGSTSELRFGNQSNDAFPDTSAPSKMATPETSEVSAMAGPSGMSSPVKGNFRTSKASKDEMKMKRPSDEPSAKSGSMPKKQKVEPPEVLASLESSDEPQEVLQASEPLDSVTQTTAPSNGLSPIEFTPTVGSMPKKQKVEPPEVLASLESSDEPQEVLQASEPLDSVTQTTAPSNGLPPIESTPTVQPNSSEIVAPVRNDPITSILLHVDELTSTYIILPLTNLENIVSNRLATLTSSANMRLISVFDKDDLIGIANLDNSGFHIMQLTEFKDGVVDVNQVDFIHVNEIVSREEYIDPEIYNDFQH